MIQDLIVTILIVGAFANIVYHLVKMVTRKNSKTACGCSGCEIKKNIISKY